MRVAINTTGVFYQGGVTRLAAEKTMVKQVFDVLQKEKNSKPPAVVKSIWDPENGTMSRAVDSDCELLKDCRMCVCECVCVNV